VSAVDDGKAESSAGLPIGPQDVIELENKALLRWGGTVPCGWIGQ
jgi:hypothetical protein